MTVRPFNPTMDGPDFDALVAALKAFALEGTGLGLALLENEPRPQVDDSWVEVQLSTLEDEGDDSEDVYMDPDSGRRLPRVTCVRKLGVRVAVESFLQNPPSMSGIAYLERLRSLARTKRFREALKSARLVFVQSDPPTNADHVVDEHEISRFESTFHFRWVYFVVDDAEGADRGFFNRVIGAGTLTNGNTATVPTAPLDADASGS